MSEEVPKWLKAWFIIHFLVDIAVAIPLMVVPELFLARAGWTDIDLIMTRIVAGAFFGIGIESFLGRNASLDSFKTMLNLKLIWSGTVSLGVGISMIQGAQGAPFLAWAILIVFLGFHAVWWYWRIKVGQLLNS